MAEEQTRRSESPEEEEVFLGRGASEVVGARTSVDGLEEVPARLEEEGTATRQPTGSVDEAAARSSGSGVPTDDGGEGLAASVVGDVVVLPATMMAPETAGSSPAAASGAPRPEGSGTMAWAVSEERARAREEQQRLEERIRLQLLSRYAAERADENRRRAQLETELRRVRDERDSLSGQLWREKEGMRTAFDQERRLLETRVEDAQRAVQVEVEERQRIEAEAAVLAARHRGVLEREAGLLAAVVEEERKAKQMADDLAHERDARRQAEIRLGEVEEGAVAEVSELHARMVRAEETAAALERERRAPAQRTRGQEPPRVVRGGSPASAEEQPPAPARPAVARFTTPVADTVRADREGKGVGFEPVAASTEARPAVATAAAAWQWPEEVEVVTVDASRARPWAVDSEAADREVASRMTAPPSGPVKYLSPRPASAKATEQSDVRPGC